jgi:hypothetical protein
MQNRYFGQVNKNEYYLSIYLNSKHTKWVFVDPVIQITLDI